MTFTFDHVHVICDDVALVGGFLQTVIGAEELRRNDAIMNWEYRLSGTRIFVRQRRDDESIADGDIRRAGVDHLGFTVPDMDVALAQLGAAGCRIVQPKKELRADLVTAFLMAPGGLLIELLQRG
jgi:catechol 2,3-dioxygenase-like lactoylglutathione lyase family enzyme